MIIPSTFTMLSGLAAMLVAGLLLSATDSALAGNASGTRDHRGGKQHPGGTATQGGVSVNGQSTTPVGTAPKLPGGTTSTTVHGTAGYGGLGNDPSKGKSGIIVRDHR